jgi:hypothetical protein
MKDLTNKLKKFLILFVSVFLYQPNSSLLLEIFNGVNFRNFEELSQCAHHKFSMKHLGLPVAGFRNGGYFRFSLFSSLPSV